MLPVDFKLKANRSAVCPHHFKIISQKHFTITVLKRGEFVFILFIIIIIINIIKGLHILYISLACDCLPHLFSPSSIT